MNRVFINSGKKNLPVWSDKLHSYALKVLNEIKIKNWDLSVLLCSDETIKKLNSQYRNKNEVTDVLSFELGVENPVKNGNVRFLPGDIVISLDTLKKNALYFNTGEDEELRRLVIHGILHLSGMDHKTNDSTEPMIIRQECILGKLKGERIIENTGRNKK